MNMSNLGKTDYNNRTLVEVDQNSPQMKPKADEVSFLQFLWYLRATLEQGQDTLRERLKLVGWEKMYSYIIKQCSALFVKLYSSLPPDTRRKFNNLTIDQTLHIRAKNGLGRHTATSTIMTEDLCKIMTLLQEEKCSLCMGLADDMRVCKYRKAIKSICMVDLDPAEKEDGLCIGKMMEWI